MKDFDVLQITARARESKLSSPLYNGTAGMLFDDQDNLFPFNSVRKSLEQSSKTISFAYTPASGSNADKEAVRQYIFDSFDIELGKTFDIIITPGGTGALGLISGGINSTNLILPELMWNNYLNIFYTDREKAILYPVFSLDSIASALNKSAKNQDSTILVINDPAQNPTGYTLSDEEYEKLAVLLNEYVKTHQLYLILDVAYNDYGDDISRPYRFGEKLDPKITVFYTFSASKSFGIYSIRCGALLFKKNDKLHQLFSKVARRTYSCPPSTGGEIIRNILSNPILKQEFYHELQETRNLLVKRGKIITKELDKYHISHLPYHHGFYVTLDNIEDSFTLCEHLEERNCFLVPLDKHHIRITIGSIPTNKLSALVALVNEVKNEI